MPIPIIFDDSLKVLQKGLQLRENNQQLIVSNIANSETPGYQPKRLEFEEQLSHAISKESRTLSTQRTDPRHFDLGGSVEKVNGKVHTLKTPGSNRPAKVDVDQEMLGLAKNQILYEATVDVINRKLGMLKYVAQDGR